MSITNNEWNNMWGLPHPGAIKIHNGNEFQRYRVCVLNTHKLNSMCAQKAVKCTISILSTRLTCTALYIHAHVYISKRNITIAYFYCMGPWKQLTVSKNHEFFQLPGLLIMLEESVKFIIINIGDRQFSIAKNLN